MPFFVDAIYCINLREREDRYQECRAELAKAGWLEKTTFFRPEKHPVNGHIGCYESHRTVIQRAQQRRQNYVLILEDDFVMEGQVSEKDVNCFKVLRNAADIYYLGQYPILDRKSTRLNSSHIQKSRMPSSA